MIQRVVRDFAVSLRGLFISRMTAEFVDSTKALPLARYGVCVRVCVCTRALCRWCARVASSNANGAATVPWHVIELELVKL